MKVILLDRVAKLGVIGDQVIVKDGYARNFLIPQKKAVLATEKNQQIFETRRQELEVAAKERLAKVNALAESIKSQHSELTIEASVGSEGKLFGSITNKDIELSLKEKGIEVKKSQIRIIEGTIRQLGEYSVNLHLHPEVDVKINLVVTAKK